MRRRRPAPPRPVLRPAGGPRVATSPSARSGGKGGGEGRQLRGSKPRAVGGQGSDHAQTPSDVASPRAGRGLFPHCPFTSSWRGTSSLSSSAWCDSWLVLSLAFSQPPHPPPPTPTLGGPNHPPNAQAGVQALNPQPRTPKPCIHAAQAVVGARARTRHQPPLHGAGGPKVHHAAGHPHEVGRRGGTTVRQGAVQGSTASAVQVQQGLC